jgi:pyruvate formate lyase activating enzyme
MSKEVSIEVDGIRGRTREGITIREVLEVSGYRISRYPEAGSLFVPCGIGGCWSCTVEVNGEVKPACVTPVTEGLRIDTDLPNDYIPRRIVHGFTGHAVGGVGTPWWLKGGYGYIEVACFAAGCNLLCPQCQNWETTYQAKGEVLSPGEAAEIMTTTRRRVAVNRMAISGGESTLNREWLVEYVRELKKLNPDPNARIHVDTNASVLTKDYVDELVEAGLTDIGIDLKGYYPETFMWITGIEEKELAERYLNTAWDAATYMVDRYRERVFTGIGIPYNKELISVQEMGLLGEKLYEIDPEIQVCVLDYRPEFKRLDLVKPSYDGMVEVHRILTREGLKTVICQTDYGHIGPEL